MPFLTSIASALGNGLSQGGTSAEAAARANAVSKGSQTAQGEFNQKSATMANDINQRNLSAQYDFNSSQAALANQFTSDMWDKTADFNKKAWMATAMENQRQWEQSAAYNKEMWQKEADYNSSEAQKNRDWQKMMSDTQITRAAEDMKRAGLNPILAIQNGAGIGSGATASVGPQSMSGIGISPTSMSSAQGQMATGGLLGANTASEGNYTGIAEYIPMWLSLLNSAIDQSNAAKSAINTVSNYGENLAQEVADTLKGDKSIFTVREGSLADKALKLGSGLLDSFTSKDGKPLQKASDKLENAMDKYRKKSKH